MTKTKFEMDAPGHGKLVVTNVDLTELSSAIQEEGLEISEKKQGAGCGAGCGGSSGHYCGAWCDAK